MVEDSITLKQEKTVYQSLTMMFFAWYPILNIYKTPFPLLGYGTMFMLLLWFFSLVKGESIPSSISLPRKYFVLWLWCAIAYIVSYLPKIKPSSFIPGGLEMFIFSVVLGFVIKNFDYQLFKHHVKIVVIVAGMVLILQELMYFTIGSRFVALLPFGQLMDGVPISDLIAYQVTLDRSSSLFREPAHFAQFLLPLLCLNLFSKENKDRIITPFGVLIILLLLLLRSGNGFVGLMLILSVKLLSFYKSASYRLKILTLAVIAPLAFFSIRTYISTEVGAAMLERSEELKNEETADSYIRVYRGFALYSELPTKNKLIGTNNDNLLQIIPRTTISYLFRGDDDVYNLYMNGIQHLLIHNGIIGLLLFLFFYFSIFREKGLQSKMQVLLLLILSLLGQTFLSFSMLYCTVFAIKDEEIKTEDEEDSLLCEA